MTQQDELNALLRAAWYGDEAALSAMTDRLLEVFQEQGRGGDKSYKLYHRYHEGSRHNRFHLDFLYGAVDDKRVLVDVRDEWVWLAVFNSGGWSVDAFAEKFPVWFSHKINDHKDRVMRRALWEEMRRLLLIYGNVDQNAATAMARDVSEAYLGTPDFESVINGKWLKEDRQDVKLPRQLRHQDES